MSSPARITGLERDEAAEMPELWEGRMEPHLRPCLHFVGFRHPEVCKDERYERAVKIWGEPDFIHRGWDNRAQREIADCDTIIFATGDGTKAPRFHSYDDSAEQ